MTSLQTASIHIDYQLKRAAFTLDVNVQVSLQGITAIFGHSGSGKSTLLRCIAGLETAEQAYLQIADSVWEDSRNGICLPTHQRQIAYVFQEPSLFPHLSAIANIEYGKKRSRPFKRSDAVEQAIELLGITHLLQRMPDQLSGGERQRVAIARALAVCPRLLLMDEPLAALDIKRKLEILPFLERLHQDLDIPMLYVTHSPAEVKRLADDVIILDEGHIQSHGSLANMQPYLLDENALLEPAHNLIE